MLTRRPPPVDSGLVVALEASVFRGWAGPDVSKLRPPSEKFAIQYVQARSRGFEPHEAPWTCWQLTGSIPPELGKLVKLEGLSVYDNDITGCIPTALLERPSLDVDHDDLRER